MLSALSLSDDQPNIFIWIINERVYEEKESERVKEKKKVRVYIIINLGSLFKFRR